MHLESCTVVDKLNINDGQTDIQYFLAVQDENVTLNFGYFESAEFSLKLMAI